MHAMAAEQLKNLKVIEDRLGLKTLTGLGIIMLHMEGTLQVQYAI